MPVQLLRLRGVLEDEADELRELLERNAIDYYETPAGNWGISMPALWLRDETQLERARLLIDEYQRERAARAREAHRQLKREGRHTTLIDVVRNDPLRVLAYLAIVALVLYFSTMPFLDFGR